MELRGWNGFFAPARTPEPIVARLQQEIAKAAQHPDVRRRAEEVGAEPVGSTPPSSAGSSASRSTRSARSSPS